MQKIACNILLSIVFVCCFSAKVLAYSSNADVQISPYKAVENAIEAQKQIPADAILCTEPLPQVSGSETTRLQPTHSGKTDRPTDSNCTYSPNKSQRSPLCRVAARLLHNTTPRFYYVIALRRIIC